MNNNNLEDNFGKDFVNNTHESNVSHDKPESHLEKVLVSRSRRTLIYSLLGLLGIMILFLIFGQSLLVNFTVLLGNTKNNSTIKVSENKPFVIPVPILDSHVSATNSAIINISGTIITKDQVKLRLLVNNELTDVLSLNNEKEFIFQDIKLNEGKNNIKTVAEVNGNIGDYSNIIVINYNKKKPILEIEYPNDGTEFTSGNSTITVKGKTDPEIIVRVNDYIAITKNDGSFSYDLTLQNGDNSIQINAQDQAGNQTEKVIKVSYSP